MKKIVSLLLALIMVFALAACGQSARKNRAASAPEKRLVHRFPKAYSTVCSLALFFCLFNHVRMRIVPNSTKANETA